MNRGEKNAPHYLDAGSNHPLVGHQPGTESHLTGRKRR